MFHLAEKEEKGVLPRVFMASVAIRRQMFSCFCQSIHVNIHMKPKTVMPHHSLPFQVEGDTV